VTATKSKEIAIVVTGHVDAGKSTLVGQIMQSLNTKIQRDLEKQRTEAQSLNKESFLFAWNTDGMQAEKERGVTID